VIENAGQYYNTGWDFLPVPHGAGLSIALPRMMGFKQLGHLL